MRLQVAVILLCCSVLAGCTAGRAFEGHLAAGRWAEAERTFRADSSLHDDERALFQAALLHVSPGTSTFDPPRARELFGRLLRLHPATSHREAAARYLALLDEIESARYAALARERRLELERERLETEVARLRADMTRLETRLLSQGDQRTKLEADLRAREEQLRVLRIELERLKAIDLRTPRSGS